MLFYFEEQHTFLLPIIVSSLTGARNEIPVSYLLHVTKHPNFPPADIHGSEKIIVGNDPSQTRLRHNIQQQQSAPFIGSHKALF